MAIHKYPEEVQRFIAENVTGRTTRELVELTNAKFGTSFTESSMKAYKNNHGLKNGTRCGLAKGTPTKKFPAEVREFINSHYIGTGHTAMAQLVNEAFGTNYTKEHMKNYYARNNLNSGLTGYFDKGREPWNKGKPKTWVGGEATQFKKGNIPPNRLPIGSERIDSKDGYIYVKIQDGHLNNNWKQKHVLIWEQHNGPVPDGHVIIFGDGDKRNLDINNLILVSRKQLARLNHRGLIQKDADLTRIGITIADISSKISQRKKAMQATR